MHGFNFTNHSVGYACVFLQNDRDTEQLLAIVLIRKYYHLGVGVFS